MTLTDKIFSNDALSVIRNDLKNCNSSEDFLVMVDSVANDTDYVISYPEPIEIAFDLKGSEEEDANNARLIYDALGPMDPANASDPRLWSYLSLVTFREYVVERWPNSHTDNFKDYIRDHWFLQNPSPRRIVRNGISRLWWVANYTYDENLEHPASSDAQDPFAYTDWMFDIQDRVSAIFERTIARSPQLRWSVLDNLSKAELPDEINSKRFTQRVARNVNLRAGYRRLEALSKQELHSVVKELITDTISELKDSNK